MSGDAICVSGVSYTYPDGRRAIEDVSLSLAAGEALGVIGPNGAGKTTLFLLLAGLLPPDQGSITIFGRSYGEGDDAGIRRRLGFVFQETEDQLFCPRLFDDVAFGPLNFGSSPAEVRRRVDDALRRVGLPGQGDRVPHHLSSGERRRAAIATVLSYDPDILILDEPSNDLDARGRKELRRLLRSTRQARMIASHDMELILTTCTRVLVLDGGKVMTSGPAAEVLCDRGILARHGLEAPLGLRGLAPEELRGVLEGEE